MKKFTINEEQVQKLMEIVRAIPVTTLGIGQSYGNAITNLLNELVELPDEKVKKDVSK